MHAMRTLQTGWTGGTRRPLGGDRRGAVIVIAVFMSIFLVGCLWYLIGIGDAALYRQRLDAASDAAAYTSAVYHARGMNMIAMLNLIIAASLALVVVAKLLNYVIGMVYDSASWMCTSENAAMPPDACKIAKESGKKVDRLLDVIDEVERNSDELLASLSKAQRDVARLTPWVASTESTMVAQFYKGSGTRPLVKTTLAVSPSMVEHEQRLGLPVRDEQFPETCERGNVIGPWMIKELIPEPFRKVLELAKQSPEDLAATFPRSYCGNEHYDGDSFKIFNHKVVCENEQAKNKDKDKDKDKDEGAGGGQSGGNQSGGKPEGGKPEGGKPEGGGKPGGGGGKPPGGGGGKPPGGGGGGSGGSGGSGGGGSGGSGGGGGDGGDGDDGDDGRSSKECVKGEELTDEQIKKQKKKEGIPEVKPETGMDGVPDPELKTAKEMYPPAWNGNGFMQVYGFAEGNTEWLRKVDALLLAAVGREDLTIAASALEGHAMSQAEFYYDQTHDAVKEDRCWYQGGPCGMAWPQYQENVLWNLRWRARLRYFREPGNDVDVNVLEHFPKDQDRPEFEDSKDGVGNDDNSEGDDNYVPTGHLSHYAGYLDNGAIKETLKLREALRGRLKL